MKEKERYKRIVVKVGTAVISSDNNGLNKEKVRNLAYQVANLADRGMEVIIVTSGAIGAGMGILKKCARPQSLPELQACAAIGQNQLMRTYGEFFRTKGYVTAQILLTQEDLTDRKRYLNAKNTLFTLLAEKAIPIINENDSVSTEEIRFGDNDRLSSLVATLVAADLLVILTNVDGLCRFNKRRGRKAECVGLVEKITREIEDLAMDQKSAAGTGGMVSKLQAVKIAASSGAHCVIANGNRKDILLKIAGGEKVGTLFLPSRNVISAKRHWLAYTSRPQGVIKVDKGAREALAGGQKSLLPSGVIENHGRFDVGDVVSVVDEKNEEFAKGLANYSSLELKKIKGLKTNEIEIALGYKHYDEVIHRDNLVIL